MRAHIRPTPRAFGPRRETREREERAGEEGARETEKREKKQHTYTYTHTHTHTTYTQLTHTSAGSWIRVITILPMWKGRPLSLFYLLSLSFIFSRCSVFFSLASEARIYGCVMIHVMWR